MMPRIVSFAPKASPTKRATPLQRRGLWIPALSAGSRRTASGWMSAVNTFADRKGPPLGAEFTVSLGTLQARVVSLAGP